jgi:hypothetical protein
MTRFYGVAMDSTIGTIYSMIAGVSVVITTIGMFIAIILGLARLIQK